MSVLDNPVWWALTGSQRHLGSVSDRVARFDPEVSPFAAAVDAPTDDDWAELAGMAGPGGQLALIEQGEGAITPGHGWTAVWEASGVQMVWDRADVEIGARPLRTVESPTPTPSHPIALGQDDVGDMLDLVAVARPGPFLARTVEFGGYLGVRDAGRLIAMAGERLRPTGTRRASGEGGRGRHRRAGRHSVPPRGVDQRHRHPPVRVDGLCRPSPGGLRRAAGPRRRRRPGRLGGSDRRGLTLRWAAPRR